MNLKTEQRKYKVFLDESYEHETEEGKTANQWRYYELRGRYGYVYPYSVSHLCVTVQSSKVAQKARTQFPSWPVIQDGDRETTLKLESKGFEDAAQIIKARRKRVGNPENGQRLAQYHFKARKVV